MDEFGRQIRSAQARLRPVNWSQARSARVHTAIERKRRRFALSTAATASAIVATAIVVAIAWFAQAQNTSQPAPAPEIRLVDGTSAIALGSDSKVRLLEEQQQRVSFEVETGKGWFEVTPSSTRTVEVRAQDVRVEVLGTEFVVEIRGEHVHVWVHRGKVRVTSSQGVVELRVGQHRSFPSRAPEADSEHDEPNEIEEAPEVSPVGSATNTRVRRAVQEPKSIEEPAMPKTAPVDDSDRIDSVEELWETADQARVSGDLPTALSALVSLIHNYPDDPRAALAAFTLGRMLIDSGRSARTAARAFAKARKLAPQGPLVEDALVREIDAWIEYGDFDRARSRCKKYLRLFPGGHHFVRIETLWSDL